METKTMSKALWNKAVESVDNSTWKDIAIGFGKASLAVSISSIMLFPNPTISVASTIWYAGDFALPKIAGSFLVVYSFPVWSSCVRWVFVSARESLTSLLPVETYHGVLLYDTPVVEIADFIFRTSGFRRSEAEETLGMSRKNIEKIAEGLERARVFVRGENNARVLRSDMSRADVVKVLTSAARFGGEFGDLAYVSVAPSMPTILSEGG